ncbi:MAG TPA: divalent-cation tolerance protein CutA [Methylotenera sp.]|nr:divalent-cation tolerance protein CutA [Methylotenera sp.]
MKIIAIFTSVGNHEEAKLISSAIVEKKLAACAQLSEIESFYHWNGSLQNEKEYRIMFKADAKNYNAIEDLIKKMHSYDLPAIHGIVIDEISQPYQQWVIENSKHKL